MRKPKTPVRRAVKAVTRGDACSPPCVVCLLVRGSNAKKETVPKPVQNDLVKFNDLMDEIAHLRGEVRRLRRALRTIAGYVPYPEDIAEAALAPRRRKKP